MTAATTLKSYRVDALAPAKADLAEISAFFRSVDPTHGAATVGRLLDAADTLAVLPYRGQVYRASRVAVRAVRVMPCLPYRVFYWVRERAAVVEVLTFRHAARRPPTRFPAG